MPTEQRQALLRRLFPSGIPHLWCPLITHYRTDGSLDAERMRSHLRHLSPHVKGFLIPGSTGDGWEMNDNEIRMMLTVAMDAANELDFHLLIGVLKTDAAAMRAMIESTLAWLKERSGQSDDVEAMMANHVCGFTVCPPQGADLSQDEIRAGLESVLQLGVPSSLYQLPQVTENEMAPELVADLAAKYPNFILFKDTSGGDKVAESGLDFGDVFRVRGAEGDYAKWPKAGGGPYNGFLLSTANCFAPQLSDLLAKLGSGDSTASDELSARLSNCVNELFATVGDLTFGNAFANANKATDHFMAFGADAITHEPPMTHSGNRLPTATLEQAAAILHAHDFLPELGYFA